MSARPGYLLDLGVTPYLEAWELQRALAGAVSQGAIPDTVVMVEHPPVVTLGRRTDGEELHVPEGAEVEVVETDRGGKSTFHGPGPARLLPDLRPEPPRPRREALLPRSGGVGHPHARRVRDRGDADRRAHRRVARAAAAEDLLDRRPHLPLGDDARLRAERRSRPGAVHGVDHRLRARGRRVHDDGAGARPRRSRSTDVRPVAAAMLGEVFDLELEELPADRRART